MKQEILDLIDIYENKEKYRQRISDAACPESISDLVEMSNLRSKIDFGKDRQRGELLKLNEIFLKELAGIKNRLGEKFFKLQEAVFPAPLFALPKEFPAYGDDLILQSDFSEPKIIVHDLRTLEGPNTESQSSYRLPDTPEIFPGEPEFEIDSVKDPYFDGFPLEVVVLGQHDPDRELARKKDPDFLFLCKKLVFFRYTMKWYEFLKKWHISRDWNGNLSYLPVLPAVMIETDYKNQNLPIVIRLGAWATEDDLKNTWSSVKRIMKDEHIKRESESKNIIRDYSWYLMNKDEKMSPAKIARFWAKKFPKELDLEVIKKVTRDEENFEDVPLEERLEEVLSDDPKMAELRGRFIEARKAHIRIDLKDNVKKSIKNLSKKINRLDPEEWGRNRKRLLQKADPPTAGAKITRSK
jgi:hypothetical protein